MTRRRNEGGRFSAKNSGDWYKAIEAANIAKIEAEWQLRQAIEEYYAQLDEACAEDEGAAQYEQAA